jgi:hypothetical protein
VGGVLEGLHDPLVRLGSDLIARPLGVPAGDPAGRKGKEAAFRSYGRMSFA